MTRQRPEESLQRSIVEYLQWVCPETMFWAVPNQRGTRSRWEMGLLQAMGVHAGAWDLHFIIPPHGRLGIIELKAGKNWLTDEQRIFGEDAEERGALIAICYTMDEVIAVLKKWGLHGR